MTLVVVWVPVPISLKMAFWISGRVVGVVEFALEVVVPVVDVLVFWSVVVVVVFSLVESFWGLLML